MFVKQRPGIEVIPVAINLVAPEQVRAAVHPNQAPAGQVRMAVAHDPAQRTFAFADLVEAVKIETQLADVGVELAEITAQMREALYFVQRIGEVHIVGVQLIQALQVVFVQLGKLTGEAAQEITPNRLPRSVATAGF